MAVGAVLAEQQGTLFPILPSQRGGWAWARGLEGTQVGQPIPTDQRDSPCHMTLWSAINPKGGGFVEVATAQSLPSHHLLCFGFFFNFSFLCFLNCLYLNPPQVFSLLLSCLSPVLGVGREPVARWGLATGRRQPATCPRAGRDKGKGGKNDLTFPLSQGLQDHSFDADI